MKKSSFSIILLICCFFFNFSFQQLQNQSNASNFFYIDTDQNVINGEEYASYKNFKPVAIAEFQNQINQNGWNYLKIKTFKHFSDYLQMRLAGYLEGYVTFEQISDYYDNYVAFSLQGEPYLSALGTAYVEDQFEFIREKISKHRSHSKFWQMVDGVLQQLEGMYEGYQARLAQEQNNGKQYANMSWFQFTLMTAREDLFEIIQCYPTPTQNSSIKIPNIGHCSGFVKMINGKLYNTHASWYTYSDMLRIYKVYEFNLNNQDVVAKTISFSSYPAHVNSLDDFYQIVTTNMSIMGTSLGFNNQSLCDTLSTKTIPSWIRVNVANRFGYDGKKWLKIYKKFFSGTHNNQWMVIDFKKFAENSPKGVLYVLENFFYLYKPFDATQSFLVKKGYFASFNAAINKEINQVAFSQSDMLFGRNMSASNQYYTAFRYFIFKKYQHEAVDLQTVKQLMRQRTYLYTNDNPMYQISCRIDLDQSCLNQSTAIYKKVDGINIGCAMGAYDCKVNDNEMMNDNTVHIINGPSTDGFPAFEFTGPWEQVPHKGIPQVMNFSWQVFDTKINFGSSEESIQQNEESIVKTLLSQIDY